MAEKGKRTPKGDWPRSVRFGDAVVRVFRRSDGYFIASWREDGRKRTTTKAGEENVLKWAEEKARALAQATGQQWVTPAHADTLKALRRIAGPGEGSMGKLLAEVESAREILDGKADLPTAARWFREFGPTSAEPVDVPDAVARFLAEYDAGSRQTRRTFGTELDAFAAAHGYRMLHDVDEPMLRRWVDRKTADGPPAPRTVKNRIATLVTLFRRARDWGILPTAGKTAPEKLRRPKIPDASREILTVDQGRALLAAVREHEPKIEAYLLIAGWLGLRPSEAVRVKPEDFHLADGYLHVTTDAALKTSQARFVPMTDGLVTRMKKLLAEKPTGKPVCLYRSREFLSVLAREHGIVERWPSDVLRHSYCSYRLAIVGDVGRVAEEAGNSPKMIRDHYRRPVKKEAGQAWWALLE